VGDKFLNHLVSSVRIVVENVIAGVKRCRIVKDVLRLTKAGISDLVMEIGCCPSIACMNTNERSARTLTVHS
jgi:hypothetical protein